MATTSKQRLALAICDFLSGSLEDGTLSSDDKDSIDVAINCIAESFKVDPADKPAVQSAIGSQNLMQIYGVYEKLKSSAKPSSSSASSAGTSTSTTAAYSAARDHESARVDAEAAVASDPKYTKAWSRLGLARFALGDARGSMEAYSQGIEYEGSGGSEAMKKGFETAKRRVEELEAEERDSSNPIPRGASTGVNAGAGGGMPDLSSLAGMFGGGGAGGGGGMPDLSSIMSNPMFANMAQSLMSNPDMMQNLMSNPRLREMADRFTQGGGMPDMASLMNDPNIAEMARNMMGGGGRGGAPGSGGQ
ncbi:small glutamine-rich tetratricopeptide repeat-containing protein 2-like protein [Xylaria longipes]|nr:small glutamine-rich tetratricopeptide repeat-containing protein 2-like protein [Xylaria longipes]